MVKRGLILIALAVASPAFAGAWTVCVTDSAGLLSAPVRGAVNREFLALMGAQGTGLAFNGCSHGEMRIQLLIRDEPPAGLEGVLGLAHRKGGRIEPRLQVFYGSLVRHLGQLNSSEALGRAVARVAAHEAEHFIGQQPSHCQHGLLQATLSAYELAAKESSPAHFHQGCEPAAEMAQAGLRGVASP